ncbi:unnamed protein product [Closterium sp. Yama58-4]|nr:unnamed protein product [Closterium sp. Yama58-4]
MYALGQLSAPCSCRLLSHQTLLWHHRLGHPSLPRLRGMHSRLLVSGLPRSLPPLPRSPAPPCLPCVEGRQRDAPHSSSFPPMTAPLQTLHMDVWGPARVSGQGRERYFLLVVDDYSRYTTVFPLRNKGEVPAVLIPWIHAVRLQLRERFRTDFPVLRLHSDRGGEFSSDLLRDFCHREGILQSFTLLASPQQNGIAERRIGLVMEVARTSMIHAAAPHFLWPFAVRYAAHQLNLWPRVSLPETSPTLRWTGEASDASRFRVWGFRAFVRDTTADKLSSRAIPCVFLGFPPDAPGWQFYHPTSRRVFTSLDVTFDESVPFYRLFPYRTAPLPPPPFFLAPGPPLVDPLPPQGPAPSGVSQVDPLPLAEPVEVTGDSGAAGGGPARGAAPGGTEPERAEPGGAEPGGAEPECVEPGGAEPAGAELRGAESGRVGPRGAASSLREPLSPQQLREWLARRSRLRSGAAGAGGAGAGGFGAGAAGPGGAHTGGTGAAGAGGAASPGGAGGPAGAGGTEGIGATSPGGLTGASPPQSSRREPLSPQQLREWLARRSRLRSGAAGAGGAGAGGSGAGAAGPGGARTRGTGAAGAGGAAGTGGAGAAGPGGARTGELLVLEVLALGVLVLLKLELQELVVLQARELVALALEALGLEVPELEALALEALELEVLQLETLALETLGLEALELEVLEPEALELEALELEALELEVMGREALELETLELEALELEVLELEALELEALALEALELELSELPPESVLRQVLSLPSSTALPPGSPLPVPSSYTEQPVSLTERREPASRPVSPVRAVRTARRVPRPRPPPVPGTHYMALRPSSAPQRVPLPSPPASSLPEIPDPESDRVRAASPTVTRLLATVVTDPSLQSTAAFALVAELVDFAAACRLDYAASLVAESESVCPLSVGDSDALDIPTPRSYAEAISGPYSSQWQTAMDVEMASWKSTGTYVDEVPPPGANIVDGMWIFRVKRPPGSPPVFKARYVARGLSQQRGVEFFQTFSPTPKMTTLRLRRPPGFTGSFPPGTQWSLRRPVYGLRQAPRKWHDTLRTTLAALGFAPSTADPSLFLRTDTSLPPFYILVYVDDLVFATADTKALALVKSELQTAGL